MSEVTFTETSIVIYPKYEGGGGSKPDIYDCDIQLIYGDNGAFITCKLRGTDHEVKIVTQEFKIRCVRVNDLNDKDVVFIFADDHIDKIIENGEEIDDFNSHLSPKEILDKQIMNYLKLIVKPKIEKMMMRTHNVWGHYEEISVDDVLNDDASEDDVPDDVSEDQWDNVYFNEDDWLGSDSGDDVHTH
jgi:hypothetical protein